MPSESPAAEAVDTLPPLPLWPNAKIGIATAAAMTPASAASSTPLRRSGWGSATFSARSGGNSVCRPSMSSWNSLSGRSMSFSR